MAYFHLHIDTDIKITILSVYCIGYVYINQLTCFPEKEVKNVAETFNLFVFLTEAVEFVSSNHSTIYV